MSTPDGDPDRDVAAVLDELIDLVRDIKQIEWISHRGGERQVLEELEEFLKPQIEAIARLEAKVGSPLTQMVTPSARPRAPLASSDAAEAVRDRLVPHLRAVAADVREHAENCNEAEADFLRRLADDLDRYADRLKS